MREFLAVDAGGTSTRAVLIDSEGAARGFGRAASGNPTSAEPETAIASVASAIEQALATGRADPAAVEVVLVAHAGGHPTYVPGIQQRLQALGVTAPIVTAGDLLAIFASGTHATDGAALIAGTGAIGGAVRGGGLDHVVDGTGWLLGDAGSGFWIGHRVARAVVDALDGGRATALTAALLHQLGLQEDEDRAHVHGRPPVFGRLVTALYALRPVQLSRFAPLAFELAAGDEVASEIVRDAIAALTALLTRVRAAQADGPLVFGGSVLIEGVLRLDAALAAPLLAAAGASKPIPVEDGLVGAAVLALRAAGTEVDANLHAALTTSIRSAAAAPHPS